MSQRKSGNARPSGTDGSDFSFRMVVDSRYQKVAYGKSRLSALILTQAIIQFVAAGLVYLLSTPKGAAFDVVSVSSTVFCFVSLLLGEYGRKRNRVGLMKFYMFGTSVAAIISVASLLMNGKSLEIIKDLSRWETSKFELFNIVAVILGVVVQIFTISVTTSLVSNMAPPKRAS